MHKHYNRVPAEAFQRLNDLDIFVTSKVKRGTRGFGRLRIPVRISRGSVYNVANNAINSLITPRSGETMRHQLGSNKNNLLRVCMVPTVTSANRVHKPATLCLINTRSLRSNANITLTTNLAACVSVQKFTNFCPHALISTTNVQKKKFA